VAPPPVYFPRLNKSRQSAVHWEIVENGCDGHKPVAQGGAIDSTPPPSIITAFGEPTTADIFGLYDKHVMRYGTLQRMPRANACDESGSKPLLTVFIIDLYRPKTLGEVFRLIRLYFSANYPVLMVFSGAPRANRVWGIFPPDLFRFYRMTSEGFEQMYWDISLINRTISRAQNMPNLTLRRSDFVSAIFASLKKGAWQAFRLVRSRSASLSAVTLIQLRKAALGFGH